MAVDFSKTAEKNMAQTAAGIAPAAPELPEVKEYNIETGYDQSAGRLQRGGRHRQHH